MPLKPAEGPKAECLARVGMGEWGCRPSSSSLSGEVSLRENRREAASNEMPHPQLRGFRFPLHLEYLILIVLEYI